MLWHRVTLTATLLLLVTGLPARSRNIPPRTVRDYFLLLPHKYFDVPPTRGGWWLKNPGLIEDTRHDYLYFPGDGAQPTLTVALFRYHGTVLVALQIHMEGDSLAFLHYTHGQWRDVTRQVLPVRFNGDYQYKLPRVGTTIRVNYNKFNYQTLEREHKVGQHVYDLVWAKGRFVVRR